MKLSKIIKMKHLFVIVHLVLLLQIVHAEDDVLEASDGGSDSEKMIVTSSKPSSDENIVPAEDVVLAASDDGSDNEIVISSKPSSDENIVPAEDVVLAASDDGSDNEIVISSKPSSDENIVSTEDDVLAASDGGSDSAKMIVTSSEPSSNENIPSEVPSDSATESEDSPALSYEKLFYKPPPSSSRNRLKSPTPSAAGEEATSNTAIQPAVGIKKQTARMMGWLDDLPEPVFQQMITDMSEVSARLGDHWFSKYATKIRDDLVKLRGICTRKAMDKSAASSPLDEAIRVEIVKAIEKIQYSNDDRISALLNNYNENMGKLKTGYNKLYKENRQLLFDITQTLKTKKYFHKLKEIGSELFEVETKKDNITKKYLSTNNTFVNFHKIFEDIIAEVDNMYNTLMNVDLKVSVAARELPELDNIPFFSLTAITET